MVWFSVSLTVSSFFNLFHLHFLANFLSSLTCAVPYHSFVYFPNFLSYSMSSMILNEFNISQKVCVPVYLSLPKLYHFLIYVQVFLFPVWFFKVSLPHVFFYYHACVWDPLFLIFHISPFVHVFLFQKVTLYDSKFPVLFTVFPNFLKF